MNQKEQYEESLNRTLDLFRQGNSMPEIAYKRKLAFSTIEKHLRELLEEKKIELPEVLEKNTIKAIEEVAEDCDSLRDLKEKLPEEISYSEIKSVLVASGRLKKKKRTAIDKAINIYMGNYCFRKCFNHPEIIKECSEGFDALRKSLNNVEISLKEFNGMMKNSEIMICKLPYENRIRYVSWRYFECLKKKGTDFWDLRG